MAINPNNGVLDIVNGVLKVSSIDIKESGGFATAINTVARNDVLLYDDQHTNTTFLPAEGTDYRSTAGVSRDTYSIDFNDGWVYWPLKLPNSWHAQFDMRITATGGVFTFSLFNTSTPNHTDYTANDGGYKIVFDNTNNQIDVYWEGSVHATVSANVRSTDWQHVNINYFRGGVSVSLAGKVVLNHGFTENYQEVDSRYVGFSATSGTSHEIRNLAVHNSDKWLYTKTSNASDITYVSGNVGIGTLTPTELLDVHGNVHVAKNLTVNGNLTVSGTTTFIDTQNLAIEDPIIEVARGNASDTIDAGLVITRATSNVAVAYRGDEEELALGYTQSGASDTDVTPIADGGLDVRVYGNLFANNLTTTANVEATYLKGDGSEITQVTLDQVVGYANTTANTIQLTNSDVGLKATGNVKANYFVGNGSKLTGLVTDLQSVTDNGNTTSNTVQFTNATTALIADSNVGIGTSTPSANLHVVGHQYVNDPPTLANAFDHSDAPLTLTHGTPTSTTAIDDPKAVLHLARDGTSGESYGARASFNLSRYENSGTASRSRLDVALADGTYTETNVMSIRADGKVGVGTDTPAYTLDVAGDINLSGDFYQGGSPFVSSLWTSGNDSLYYTTNNVGIGTNTAEYTLDVHGNANVGALTTTSVSGDGSALYGIQSSNVSNFASNVTRITNLETSNGHIWSNLESNVTTLRSEMASNTVTLRGDLQSNVTTLRSEMASNTVTLRGDLQSNVTTLRSEMASNIVTLRGDLQSNVTTLRDTAITFTGIKTFQNDVILESNLRVQGDLLVANTINMTVSDPILELGSNNQNTGDIGLVMTRHGASNSNVAIFFDESVDVLKLGYTLNGANDTTLEFDSNALAVSVQGALTAASVSGDGSGLTSLNAGNVSSGTLGTARIPNLDAGKITTGTLTRPISTTTGTFSGDVGIGTTSPARPLTIESSSFDGIRVKRTIAGGGSAIELINGNDDEWTVGVGGTGTFGIYDGATFGEQFAIDTSGNVGIGTTSPAYKLDVSGTGRFTGTVTAPTFSGNATTAAALETARTIALTGDVTGSAAFDGSGNISISTTSSGGGSWTTSGSDIYYNSGNVGIGTTNPATDFHVGVGDANIRIGAINYSGSAANTTTYGLERSRNQILFSTWRDAQTDKIGAKICSINKQTYSSPTVRHLIQSTDLAFYTVPPGSASYDGTVERLRITDTGYVGIGTTSPLSPLHIRGNNCRLLIADSSEDDADTNAFNCGIAFVDNTYDGTGTYAGNPAAGMGFFIGHLSSGSKEVNVKNLTGELSFGTRNVIRAMYINNDGNVGIGTTSPGYKLDVNGTLRATTGTFSGVVTMRGQQDNADGSDRAGYWNYDNKVALVLEPAANDGAVAILFPSQGNKQSDFAYIVYDEDYGEAGVSAGENGALILGCENDGGGSSDHVRVKSRLVVEADQSSSDPTNAFQVKSSNTTSDLFNVTRSGNVGIGTTTPYTPLHVTRSSGSISAAYTIYAKGNDAYYSRQFHVQTSMGWTGMSIYASDDIVTQQYLVSHLGTLSSSDERIKENITDIDDNSALDLVRKLKPKTYEYIDKIKRGSDRVYGFIAQDIESLIPYGTRKVEEVIPNIMEVATVTDSNVISFVNFNTSNLESDTHILQLTDKNGKDILATIESIIDEKTVRVKEDLSTKLYEFDELGNDVTRYSIITKSEYEQLENKSGYTLDETTQTYSKLLSNEIYVYGEKIDNFLKVNKDYIWTVATAALQEVDRQLQAEKAKVATLETQLALVLARLDALENA